MAFLDRIRSENPCAVIAMDNGDAVRRTHRAVPTKGGALLAQINALGLAALKSH